MTIKPTDNNGRIVEGDTPWGRYSFIVEHVAFSKSLRIIDDAGNVVGSARLDAAEPKPAPAQNPDCAHRGEESGESDCATCKGSVKIKLFACTVHGTCHRSPREVAGVKSCIGCAEAQCVPQNGDLNLL